MTINKKTTYSVGRVLVGSGRACSKSIIYVVVFLLVEKVY